MGFNSGLKGLKGWGVTQLEQQKPPKNNDRVANSTFLKRISV
jgi:hypothetical protein